MIIHFESRCFKQDSEYEGSRKWAHEEGEAWVVPTQWQNMSEISRNPTAWPLYNGVDNFCRIIKGEERSEEGDDNGDAAN